MIAHHKAAPAGPPPPPTVRHHHPHSHHHSHHHGPHHAQMQPAAANRGSPMMQQQLSEQTPIHYHISNNANHHQQHSHYHPQEQYLSLADQQQQSSVIYEQPAAARFPSSQARNAMTYIDQQQQQQQQVMYQPAMDSGFTDNVQPPARQVPRSVHQAPYAASGQMQLQQQQQPQRIPQVRPAAPVPVPPAGRHPVQVAAPQMQLPYKQQLQTQQRQHQMMPANTSNNVMPMSAATGGYHGQQQQQISSGYNQNQSAPAYHHHHHSHPNQHPQSPAGQQLQPDFMVAPGDGPMMGGEPLAYHGQPQSTLLQQQLNRQRAPQAPLPHQQPPQTLVMAPQQGRGPRAAARAALPPPPTLAQAAMDGQVDGRSPAYYQQAPVRAQKRLQQQHHEDPHHQQRHHQQQAHLLVGNPTPPLTPNGPSINHQHHPHPAGMAPAPPAPPMRPQHSQMDDWHPHHHHQQQQPLPAPHMAQPPPPPPHSQSGPQLTAPAPTSDHNNHLQAQLTIGSAPHLTNGSSVNNNDRTIQATSMIPKSQPVHPFSSPPRQQQSSQQQLLLSSNLNQHMNNNNLSPAAAAPASAANQNHYHYDHQQAIRLTLPLRDSPLVGPFRLEHDAQFTTKVFHLKPQLFDSLSKSMNLINPQAATVIQELQFRTYLVGGDHAKNASTTTTKAGDSLLASNQQQHNHQSKTGCNWPELFQLSINQQIVHLDRSAKDQTATHKSIDISQYCQPGDNLLEIQVNDCYCQHEFVIEPVDRPTLRAFMNSCYKSRMLSLDACLARLRQNFGSSGFVLSQTQVLAQLQASAGIHSEYITEYIQTHTGQQVEQTKARASLRCPISGRRMRTPIRGPSCKHLQCFDLENFLQSNRDKTQWNCPICSLAIPFNMLELDQHQLQILQTMQSSEQANVGSPTTDDILVDHNGQWQAYYPAPAATQQNALPSVAVQTIAKTNGTFHPLAAPAGYQHQGPGQIPAPQQQQPVRRPSSWQQEPIEQQQQQSIGSHRTSSPVAVRRPPSSLGQQQTSSSGRRSANGSPLAKRSNVALTPPVTQPAPFSNSPQSQRVAAGQHSPVQSTLSSSPYHMGGVTPPAQLPPQPTRPSMLDPSMPADDLSPLAAMERTIIQHEQQMGPPPFDPSGLATSPLAARPSNGAPAPLQSLAQHQSPSHEQVASSPITIGAASPSTARLTQVPASPIQQSPKHHVSSTPATPIVSIPGGGPETPATPSNSMQLQQQHSMASAGQPIASNTSCTNSNNANVDHAPLSNGSASAGSIGSSSTMTPSGQSLGSVGMGGDSRCNTAPLPTASGAQAVGSCGSTTGHLDDLMLPGGSGMASAGHGSPYGRHAGGGSGQTGTGSYANNGHHHHQTTGSSVSGLSRATNLVDEKNHELLMSKLSSAATVGGEPAEFAFALEEAEWKHQLDRGKSEHLANFLNDPLMTSSNKHHHHFQPSSVDDGANKMLSGGLNPSDDENDEAELHNGGAQSLNELDQFAGYLDASGTDDGAGLPPDDRILEIFER